MRMKAQARQALGLRRIENASNANDRELRSHHGDVWSALRPEAGSVKPASAGTSALSHMIRK